MESIRKLTTVEKQEVNNYFKEQLKEEREIMENHYKEQEEIDNYFKEQLKKIIFSKNCSAPKEKSEGAELAIAITINSFPKHCHEFILNKPKEN
jgi:hypothetical protein